MKKVDDVKAQGALERGEFNPRPGSTHLRMYKYWLDRTEFPPSRENFCHYWRVVIFWAPAMWLFIKVIKVIIQFFDSRPLRALGRVIAWPFRKVGRLFRHVNPDTVEKIVMHFLLGTMAVCVLLLLGAYVAAFFEYGFLHVLGITGILLTALTLIVGTGLLIGWRSEVRSLQRADARHALGEKLCAGEITSEEYLTAVRARKEPGVVKRFFRSVGDFFGLLYNMVRVKKWKICPYVEIPE